MIEDLRVRIAALHSSLDELDYYELLDLDNDVGHDDVRDAFYRFASDMHPDQHVGEDEETRARVLAIFKRGNEAYTVLSDPRRRRLYDEGLARGERRLLLNRASKVPQAPKDPASALESSQGQQFYRMAMQALAKGDLQSARLNLTVALRYEAGSKLLEERLREVEAKLKGKKT